MKYYFLFLFTLFYAVCASGQAQENFHDSLTVAVKALRANPASVDLQLRKAGFNIQLEQWQYAIDTYSELLATHPNNIAALYYRAYAYERLRKYAFARADYKSLLTIVPEHFEARLGLALLNEKDNRNTEAIDEINRLIEAFPDSAITYAMRAGIEKAHKQIELAEFDYSEAIKRAPSNIDYLLNRMELRILLNRKEDALSDLDRLAALGVPKAQIAFYYRQCRKK